MSEQKYLYTVVLKNLTMYCTPIITYNDFYDSKQSNGLYIYVTNRKSVRRVHHPSRELWCQRQQSAPCPTAEEAPAAKRNKTIFF